MRRRRLWLKDLLKDVVIETHTRRARSVLMILAVALSTGTLISSVGISTVAARQIDADLAASTLTLVTVSVVPDTSLDGASQTTAGEPRSVVTQLPEDTEALAERIDVVEAAGRRLDLAGLATVTISRDRSGYLSSGSGTSIPKLVGVTSGYFDAAQIDAPSERSWLLDGDEAVVFLGTDAAEALDIPSTSDPTGFGVWINGQRHAVVGFLGEGTIDMSDAVVIPYSRALDVAGNDNETRVLVRASPGGGAPVAGVICAALRPDAPERLSSSQVADVNSLRDGVSSQLGLLAGWIGVFLLLLTVLLIANSMIVSVMARTGEIGLRRALGASRLGVAMVFLGEGSLTGLLGGLAGSAMSTAAVLGVCAVNQWTAALDPRWIVLGPTVGVIVGLLSSFYPALRAANVQPAIAVRSD
jgi:putative ABC transport system permease protein